MCLQVEDKIKEGGENTHNGSHRTVQKQNHLAKIVYFSSET